jgi:hypothetical protein
MFRLNRNKQKTNQNSLIGSILCYFLQKIYGFSVFFRFSIFFCFFLFCFETVCFSCFALVPKQRVWKFRLNRNKQKTHPNSIKESMFGYFSENVGLFGLFRFVRKQFCLFPLFRYWFETPKRTENLFLVSRNKLKQTQNRSCFGLFRFEPKFIFVCFEDTLLGGGGGKK